MSVKLDMTPTPSLPCICDELDSDGKHYSRPLVGYLKVSDDPYRTMRFASHDCPQHGGYIEEFRLDARLDYHFTPEASAFYKTHFVTDRKHFLEKLPWLLPDIEGVEPLHHDPKLVPVTGYVRERGYRKYEYWADKNGQLRTEPDGPLLKEYLDVVTELRNQYVQIVQEVPTSYVA